MPPPEIRQIFDTIAIEQYPDCDATELRERLSKKLGVSVDNIVAASGTTELIRLIALTYFKTGDSVLILEPTYGEYEVACHIVGAKTIKQWMREEESFAPVMGETIDCLKMYRPRGVFFCNPNNPTGKYSSRQEVEQVLDSIGDDGLLIIDEAYISFVTRSWPSLDLIHRGNVIVLRSMTKDYGLAGLRLGYAVASRDITDSLRRVLPPWNVNTIAQKAGVIALGNEEYLRQSQPKILEAKQFLIDELSRLGFHPLSSDANFFLVKVGNSPLFRTALLKHGLLVRDCTSLGLPEYIRIGVRTMPECQRLVTTIQTMKNKGELDGRLFETT